MNDLQRGNVLHEVTSSGMSSRAGLLRPKTSIRAPRQIGILFIPIGLLLLPFADHRSRDVVFLTYSWHYLLFLVVLLTGGISGAAVLYWCVRRAAPHRRLPYAFCLLGMLIAVLLAAEAVLGYLGRDRFIKGRVWGQILSPLMGFENAPNYRWDIRNAVYTTDADTFRSHPTTRPASEEETLVVVMGGSCTFGYGLNDDETWAQRLEYLLRDRFGDAVTVLNAGNNGHNTLQQLIRFYIRVLPLRPAYVIYYGAINDVRPKRMLDRLTRLPRYFPDAKTEREYLRVVNSGRGFYFENSLLLGYFEKMLGNINDYLADNQSSHGWWKHTVDDYTETAALYIRNLDTLRLICQANGIEFIPVTFIAEYDKLTPSWDLGTPYFVETLRAHCKRTDVPFIDLIPAFERVADKASLFFPDHYHPSGEGAAFLAARIAEALIPMMERGADLVAGMSKHAGCASP